jgi:hypothetical protein
MPGDEEDFSMSAQLQIIDDLPRDYVETKKQYLFQARLIMVMNMRNKKDADVVRATGIPWATWMQWVSGKIEYPLAGEHFIAICRYLNVSADYLLGLSNELAA